MSGPLTLRVFLSSPGDVAEERLLARQVMEALAGSHLLRDRLSFKVIAWDDEHASAPMDARETPQTSVNRYTGRPADCDLTLVILWGRMGTCLPDGLTRPDGSPYESGTVWEYEDAIAADKPVFVYRRIAKPQIDIDDVDFDKKRAQYAGVKTFFDRFANPDGSLQAGFNAYAKPQDFEKTLRQHLEAFVYERLRTSAAAAAPLVGPDDASVSRIFVLIDELKSKNRQLEEKETENSRLRVEVERLTRNAIARTLSAAAQPGASVAVLDASAALEVGNTLPAEGLLREQERDQARSIAVGMPEEADQRRNTAELAREQGALAFEHDVHAALAAYRRAAEYEPNDAWTRFFLGDLELRTGDSSAALKSFQAGLDIAKRLATADPHNAEWQRDLAACYLRIGDVQAAQGDTAAALRSFQAGRVIAKRLTASEPLNNEWQHGLSISYDKIGGVKAAHGDTAAALKSFQAGLAIAERLVASEPRNNEWQRGLFVSYSRIGGVQVARGNTAAALRSFQAGLAVAKRLAAGDPRNTKWQRDLSVSYSRIGEVQVELDNMAAALKSFQADLAISDRLAASDPRNTQWQRDLSVSYDRIGYMEFTQGDTAAALKSFQIGQAISERLAASDPRNTDWQGDLSRSYTRIGDVQSAQGDSSAALKSFQAGLAIRERLAANDPRNIEWQRDLSISYDKIGEVQAAKGDTAAALESFQAGLAIRERMSAGDPRNSRWQRDIVISCWQLANLDEALGSVSARRAVLQRGFDILIKQRKRGQLPAALSAWIGAFKTTLQKLP